MGDPIAHVVLFGTAYDRVRLLRSGLLTQSLPRTLSLQSGLLLALALTLGAAGPIHAMAGPGGTFAVSPEALVFCALGVCAVLGSALGLSLVGLVRLRREPRLTEAQAERLISAEEGATLLGLGAGGLTVLVAGTRVAAVPLGFDVPAASVTLPVPGVSTLCAVALVGGVALLAASRYLGAVWTRFTPSS